MAAWLKEKSQDSMTSSRKASEEITEGASRRTNDPRGRLAKAIPYSHIPNDLGHLQLLGSLFSATPTREATSAGSRTF